MACCPPRSTLRTSAAETSALAFPRAAGANRGNEALLGTFRWRTLITAPASGADNMALDHALLRRAAATGEAVLRVYSWSRPCLSLGRHQRANGIYDPVAIRSMGLDVVRRPTGGGAVLHNREVTYSVTTSLAVGGHGGAHYRVRHIYEAVNQLLLEALITLGAPVSLAPEPLPADGAETDPLSRAAAPRATDREGSPIEGSPCFDRPAQGEIVALGRKLAGSAQWREGTAVLQHGSILLADDQQLLARLAPGLHPSPVATLADVLGAESDPGEVEAALHATLDRTLSRTGTPASTALELDESTAATAGTLRRHYADEAWTWRR
jgi:lipoyl(octanoyl) transferase